MFPQGWSLCCLKLGKDNRVTVVVAQVLCDWLILFLVYITSCFQIYVVTGSGMSIIGQR